MCLQCLFLLETLYTVAFRAVALRAVPVNTYNLRPSAMEPAPPMHRAYTKTQSLVEKFLERGREWFGHDDFNDLDRESFSVMPTKSVLTVRVFTYKSPLIFSRCWQFTSPPVNHSRR